MYHVLVLTCILSGASRTPIRCRSPLWNGYATGSDGFSWRIRCIVYRPWVRPSGLALIVRTLGDSATILSHSPRCWPACRSNTYWATSLSILITSTLIFISHIAHIFNILLLIFIKWLWCSLHRWTRGFIVVIKRVRIKISRASWRSFARDRLDHVLLDHRPLSEVSHCRSLLHLIGHASRLRVSPTVTCLF